MPNLFLLHWIVMLHLYIGGTISQTVVRGVVGRAITLPCTYRVSSRDHLSHMCWGKGKCPNSKCSNEILRTNGMQVTSRKLRRYQLNGQIAQGDVSLTILNANKGDNGAYCCRIEVSGWFNDIKKTLTLQVDIARTTASTTTVTTTPDSIITTGTTTSLATTVTLPTTTPFLSTMESSPTRPVVVSENTNDPTMVTSSVSTAIALTTASPFSNIKSLTTSFQYESTDDGFWVFATETPPTTTATTTASLASITTPDRMITINSNAFLAATVTLPTPPPFLLTTNSVSPIIPNVAPTTTDATAMTTSSVSTGTAFLTTAPSLVNIKPSPTCLPVERAKNGCLLITEMTSSIIGTANAQKYKDHVKVIPYAIASSALFLVLLVLVIVIKCKQRQKYHLFKMNNLNGQKESEQMLTGAEGENGLFIL